MGTPHVAGVAGLLWMYFPECKNYQIRNVLLATAEDLGDNGCDTKYGFGLVQAKAAYNLLSKGNCGGNLGKVAPVGGCEQAVPDGPTSAPTPECSSDSECDDGDACTVDICSAGLCLSTPDCASCGKSKVDVEITIDNYGEETAYDIKDASGNKVMEGSGWPANSVNSFWKCVGSGSYTFTITDAYGDGICCSYGQGGYVVKVDGTEVVNGGEFGDSTTETFTVNGSPPTTAPVAPPTTAPVTNPTAPPTTAPVTNPTAPPTAAPESTPSTVPVTAPSGCVTFGITLNTDAHGYETSFTLINDNTAVTRLAGRGYSSSMTFDEGTCLDNGRYIFTISDSYGDGMCCGSGQGGYELTLGGEVVKEGGQFGESESFVVEVGPQGPSRAPTPAPTCTQGGGACYVGDTCCSGRCGNSFCTYEE